MNKKMEKVLEFLIIFLMIIMSYQSIFSRYCSFLDEFVIIGLFIISILYIIFEKKYYDIKNCNYIIIIFMFLTLATFLLRKYNIVMYVIEIFNYIKIFILFESLKIAKINEAKLNKLIKYFFIINIPSMICGLYQILRFELTSETNGFMYRNNTIRIDGFAGHPITLGMIGTIIFYFSISNIKSLKKDTKYLIISIISFIIVILTKSRFPLVISIFMLLYEFIFRLKEKYNISKKNIIIAISCILLIMLIILSMNYKKIEEYIENERSSIRLYSLEMVPRILSKYPILGTGVGTYSCKVSIQYKSTVYEEFDFSKHMLNFATENISSGFESHLAKQLIETGIMGTVLYYGYFINMLHCAIKKKNKDMICFILVMLVNSIINQIYSIPLVLILGILISNMYVKEESIDERNSINANI